MSSSDLPQCCASDLKFPIFSLVHRTSSARLCLQTDPVPLAFITLTPSFCLYLSFYRTKAVGHLKSTLGKLNISVLHGRFEGVVCVAPACGSTFLLWASVQSHSDTNNLMSRQDINTGKERWLFSHTPKVSGCWNVKYYRTFRGKDFLFSEISRRICAPHSDFRLLSFFYEGPELGQQTTWPLLMPLHSIGVSLFFDSLK